MGYTAFHGTNGSSKHFSPMIHLSKEALVLSNTSKKKVVHRYLSMEIFQWVKQYGIELEIRKCGRQAAYLEYFWLSHSTEYFILSMCDALFVLICYWRDSISVS